MRQFTVVVEWADSGARGGHSVEDADEVVVYADTAAQAIDKARKKWRMTIGAEWTHCRLIRAFVLKPAKLAKSE